MSKKKTINITHRDLNEMITRAVRKIINEANGVIDPRFLNLADWIIAKYKRGVKKDRWGDRRFTIPSTVFKKFDIYGLPFKNLPVEIVDDGNDRVRGFGFERPELCLKYSTLRNGERMTIAHEFIHLIQQKDPKSSIKANTKGHWALSKETKELTDKIAYCFDPEEMAARLTEAYVTLTESPKFSPNEILHSGELVIYLAKYQWFYNYIIKKLATNLWLYEMLAIIKLIEQDNAAAFYGDLNKSLAKFKNQPEPYSYGSIKSPVFGLFLTQPWYLKNIIPDYHKLLGEGEDGWANGNYYTIYKRPEKNEAAMWFVVLQGKMLNYFRKAQTDYMKKIAKTLGGPIKELHEKVIALIRLEMKNNKPDDD